MGEFNADEAWAVTVDGILTVFFGLGSKQSAEELADKNGRKAFQWINPSIPSDASKRTGGMVNEWSTDATFERRYTISDLTFDGKTKFALEQMIQDFVEARGR